MSLQAPNVMRWTRYTDECLEALETSPAAFPSDKLFCQHVRLQHISEEFELQLLEGASAPKSIRETQAQVTHRAFKRQLADWTARVPSPVWNDALDFSRHFSSVYMNEVAMCSNSNADILENDPTADGQPLHTHAIDSSAFSECLESVDSIFRVFTAFDMSAIRALPAMYFIRIIYAAIVLVKLHFAAMQLPSQDYRSSHIRELKVREHLEHLIQMFAGWGALWPACKLTKVLRKLHTWFNKHSDSRMTLSELSWLNSWTFKHMTVDDSSGDDSGEEQHESAIARPAAEDSPSYPVQQNWTNNLPDSTPFNASEPRDTTASTGEVDSAIPMPHQDWLSASADFSEPFPAIDLDQIFPGDGAGELGFEVCPELDSKGMGQDLDMNMDATDPGWSTFLTGDVGFEVDDAMEGVL
ncbi:MAG: hypothetical protein M1837_003027 [Sclerophora amabilis]|nr:MAG: hypothetical protein M1837_003027 [Sclerophora amabilis]